MAADPVAPGVAGVPAGTAPPAAALAATALASLAAAAPPACGVAFEPPGGVELSAIAGAAAAPAAAASIATRLAKLSAVSGLKSTTSRAGWSAKASST